MGHKKMMRVIETYVSKKEFMEWFFDEKVFLKDLVVSGSTEDRTLKRKIILWRKHIFHWNLFSLRNLDWFGMIHQWEYTRIMINLRKNSEEKTCFKCLFKNEFAITMLSVGVQSANIKKRKTAFRVLFLVIENFFHEKRILIGSVKFIIGRHRNDGSIWKLHSRKKFLWKALFMKKIFEGHCFQWVYRNLKTGKKRFSGPFLEQTVTFKMKIFVKSLV